MFHFCSKKTSLLKSVNHAIATFLILMLSFSCSDNKKKRSGKSIKIVAINVLSRSEKCYYFQIFLDTGLYQASKSSIPICYSTPDSARKNAYKYIEEHPSVFSIK